MSKATPQASTLTILYFASLAESLECSEEKYTVDNDTPTKDELTVASLRQKLSARGEAWLTLTQHETIRCAVNQQLAAEESTIPLNAEVAFFPPVTGG